MHLLLSTVLGICMQVEENGASTVSVEEEEAALAQAKYDFLSTSTSNRMIVS